VRGRYCDELKWYVGGTWVCTTKTPDRNDSKLGTLVVLETLSQPTDFGFTSQINQINQFNSNLAAREPDSK